MLFRSEPSLVINSHLNSLNGEQRPTATIVKSSKEPKLSNKWERRAADISSSEEEEEEVPISAAAAQEKKESEFALLTKGIAKLLDSSKSLDIEECSSVSTVSLDPIILLNEKTALNDDLHIKTFQNQGSECDANLSDKEKCDTTSSKKIPCDKVTHLDDNSKASNGNYREVRSNDVNPVQEKGDEVDVGMDALADMTSNKPYQVAEDNKSSEVSSTASSIKNRCDKTQESEQNRMECVGMEESVLVDNLFASVASRTEALASHTTSFNLMSSRHGST